MGTTTTYVDAAFCILLGRDPEPGLSQRERRIAIMEHWDGRKFDGDRVRETIATMALCHIGLSWHPADRYPYGWELIAERLREFMPELGDMPIGARTMLDIVQGRHPSQYAGRRRAVV